MGASLRFFETLKTNHLRIGHDNAQEAVKTPPEKGPRTMSMTLSLRLARLPAGYPDVVTLNAKVVHAIVKAIHESDCATRYIDDFGRMAWISKTRAAAARTAIVSLNEMTNELDAALAYAESNSLGVEIYSDAVHFLKVLPEPYDFVDLDLSNANAVALFQILRLPMSTEHETDYSVDQVEAALEENLKEVLDFNPRYVQALRDVCAYARGQKGNAAILQLA